MSQCLDSFHTTLSLFYDSLQGNIPAVFLVYFSVVFIHFIASNIYPSMCCSWTMWGFIMSPFMAVTPHCEGLRWVIHYTGEQIRNTWVWIGGYLVYYFSSKITPYINTFRAVSSNNRESDSSTTNVDNYQQEDRVDETEEDKDDETTVIDEGTRRRRRGKNN